MNVGWKESLAAEWCVRRQFAAAASACFTDACFADRMCFHWVLQFNRLRYVINPDSNVAANIWQGITTLALIWVALVTPLQAGLRNGTCHPATYGLTWRLRPTKIVGRDKEGRSNLWNDETKWWIEALSDSCFSSLQIWNAPSGGSVEATSWLDFPDKSWPCAQCKQSAASRWLVLSFCVLGFEDGK